MNTGILLNEIERILNEAMPDTGLCKALKAKNRARKLLIMMRIKTEIDKLRQAPSFTQGGIVRGNGSIFRGDNPNREEYIIPTEVLDKLAQLDSRRLILDEALLGGIKTTEDEPKAETGQIPDAGQGTE